MRASWVTAPLMMWRSVSRESPNTMPTIGRKPTLDELPRLHPCSLTRACGQVVGRLAARHEASEFFPAVGAGSLGLGSLFSSSGSSWMRLSRWTRLSEDVGR